MNITGRFRATDLSGRKRLVTELHDSARGEWLELADGTEVVKNAGGTLHAKSGEMLHHIVRAH